MGVGVLWIGVGQTLRLLQSVERPFLIEMLSDSIVCVGQFTGRFPIGTQEFGFRFFPRSFTQRDQGLLKTASLYRWVLRTELFQRRFEIPNLFVSIKC